MSKSYLEGVLAKDLTEAGIPFEREAKLIKGRRFSYDFYFPAYRLIAEIEGGTWSKHHKSRHTEPEGFERDCEKYNEATIAGFSVLRFTSTMVTSNKLIAVTTIARFIAEEEKRGEEEAHS